MQSGAYLIIIERVNLLKIIFYESSPESGRERGAHTADPPRLLH